MVQLLLMISWLTRVIGRSSFWFVVALLVLITIPHYGDALQHQAFLARLFANVGLDRHTFERIAYLAPIIWAVFLFGYRGAMTTSFAALACMLPRAIFISPHPQDAVFETAAVFIVGNVVALSFESLRKERERRIQLAALNRIASAVSRSLELSQILNSSVDNIMNVMEVDAVLVFLVDEQAGELTLAAYQGISREFARGVDRMKLGEGFNGRVAETGEPLFVEDASQDPRLTRTAVSEENIQSQLIVPIRSKGQILGTVCVATRRRRRFPAVEMELLTAIGEEIGIAIENTRLYQEQIVIAKQLRRSEANYRDLFQNASDAIWVHDLKGNIVEANKACERLMSYTRDELLGKKVSQFLTPDALDLARDVKKKLVEGETIDQRYEQRITRRDGTEAIVELATRLITADGKPVGFQNIARDVTDERRMRDNLRFYLKAVLKAQEEERRRISRELHDDVAQSLLLLTRQLDEIVSDPGSKLGKITKARIGQIYDLGTRTHHSLRDYAQSLRPDILDHMGLISALEWMTESLSREHGIGANVEVCGSEYDVSPETKLVLFRIAQEALNNIRSHAEATNVLVKLQYEPEKMTLTIADDGKGFKLPKRLGDLVSTGRLGLTGMEERAKLLGGSVRVQSKLGEGTIVTVEIPVSSG